MVYMVGGFIFLVIFLLFVVIFVYSRSKTDEGSCVQERTETLKSLIEVLKQEKKDVSKIENALDKMVRTFPFPENEKDASDYFQFVYLYAKNPLSTAKMIVQMQKKLSSANPKYEKLIEKFQMKGVEARKR